jgi:hypothetical protein
VVAPLVALCCAPLATGCRKQAEPAAQKQAGAPAEAAPAVVVYGPWLLEPGPTRITIAWTSKDEAAGVVAYGEASLDRMASEQQPRREHRVALTGLEPGRHYRYRLAGTPHEGSFWTAPAVTDEADKQVAFRVLIYGDNRTDQKAHAEVVRAAQTENARIALHTGDMVVDAKRADLWQRWFTIEHGILASTPIIATEGNHEVTDHGVAYTAHFQPGGLPPYRSVDYGPVHLIVLDSFEPVATGEQPREGSISEAQKAWLAQDLAAVPKGKHVWVLVHQGPFSHPLEKGHGGSEGVRSALVPHAARIEAVFAGHDHFYERGRNDGLRYFVLGGGGAPLYAPNPKAPGVEHAVKSLSYAVIDVCGCHADGMVKDPSGKVLDRFQLSTCAAACPAQASADKPAATAGGEAAPR